MVPQLLHESKRSKLDDQKTALFPPILLPPSTRITAVRVKDMRARLAML